MVEPVATVPDGQADFGPFRSARAGHDPRKTIARMRKRVVRCMDHFIVTSQFLLVLEVRGQPRDRKRVSNFAGGGGES